MEDIKSVKVGFVVLRQQVRQRVEAEDQMSYRYYDKWYDKNNTPYNKKKRETTMSIRDAPQEKVGKAHKKTTNERGRPGNPDHASFGLI